ncbi:VirD4-like conjugal transfer protein, CD1115 family [Brevibacillus brevis]|uniref:Type IV secretory system conjugative DNA transfer family protein n=1 Tax=Brevibacillus brevis TaxID=1393 RepID=A0ABY9TCX6_BREBE|nr:type IV secretory system conjugative DNA transfer family protein [Brevibacillus brevis]WNC17906.1 type IV secretory system conjugative DNA transfer family protein [Brevibacillus brevis]
MRKKMIALSLLGLAALLLVVPTISFVFREFIEGKFNVNVLSVAHMTDVAFSIKTYWGFVSKVDPPNVLGWAMIGFYVVWSVINLIFGGIKAKKKFDQNVAYASHGTARWQTGEEIQKHYYGKDNAGWFLGHTEIEPYRLGGKYAYHPVNGPLNSQMVVIGPPGSKKTTGFMYGNIFHIPFSTRADMIITDPKSELFMYTAKYLENAGYDVHVLDFIHLKYGDMINPIEFITEEKELMEIAQGYVSSVTSSKVAQKSGDPIWEDGETLLLGALIGFVQQKYPPERQTFEEVAKILTSPDIRDPEAALYFFQANGITGAAKDLYDKFLLAEDKLRAGVLVGLAIKLSLFSISGVKKLTSKTTLDIRKLGAKKEKPMAVFILMPDGDKTYAPIINVIVTQMLNQMYKTAYLYGNKLHTRVFMALDELANIGRLPSLIDKLPTMRGRGIIPMMIFQSIVQMKERYKDQWEEILGNCDTQVYLGANEQTTAEYLSKLLGVTTIQIQNQSRNTKPGKVAGDGLSESFSYQQRQLMFPDECRSLDRDYLVIVQGGRQPVMLKKVQYEYWMAEKRICDPKELHELPLLDSQPEVVSVIQEPSAANEEKITDKPADNIQDEIVDIVAVAAPIVIEGMEEMIQAYEQEVAASLETDSEKSDAGDPSTDIELPESVDQPDPVIEDDFDFEIPSIEINNSIPESSLQYEVDMSAFFGTEEKK